MPEIEEKISTFLTQFIHYWLLLTSVVLAVFIAQQYFPTCFINVELNNLISLAPVNEKFFLIAICG